MEVQAVPAGWPASRSRNRHHVWTCASDDNRVSEPGNPVILEDSSCGLLCEFDTSRWRRDPKGGLVMRIYGKGSWGWKLIFAVCLIVGCSVAALAVDSVKGVVRNKTRNRLVNGA